MFPPFSFSLSLSGWFRNQPAMTSQTMYVTSIKQDEDGVVSPYGWRDVAKADITLLLFPPVYVEGDTLGWKLRERRKRWAMWLLSAEHESDLWMTRAQFPRPFCLCALQLALLRAHFCKRVFPHFATVRALTSTILHSAFGLDPVVSRCQTPTLCFDDLLHGSSRKFTNLFASAIRLLFVRNYVKLIMHAWVYSFYICKSEKNILPSKYSDIYELLTISLSNFHL